MRRAEERAELMGDGVQIAEPGLVQGVFRMVRGLPSAFANHLWPN